MRYLLVALSLLVGAVTSAQAQASVSIGLPSVEIGINVPVYPELVVVPGYPVYYDPRGDWNYFFYDGVYWVYQGDNWYAASWYDGPWQLVRPEQVPLYVLRVPVRYYRQPPPYFRGWRPDGPPRWGERWGRGWEGRHAGWDRWNPRAAPRPAPLPVYQREYSGGRYPRAMEQQRAIGSEHYRYQPRETFVRERFEQRGAPRGPGAEPRRGPEQRGPGGPGAERRGPEQRGYPGGPGAERRGPEQRGYPGGPGAEPRRGPEQRGYPGGPGAEPRRGPEQRGYQGGPGAAPQRQPPQQREQQEGHGKGRSE